MAPHSSRTALVLAVATTLAVWGTSFTCMRVALPALGPEGLSLLRYLTASIGLLACVPWTRPALPRPAELPRLVVVALSGITLYNLLLSHGLVTVGAGPGAFINNTIPLFSTLFAILLLGERPGWVVWLGMAVSLGGATLIALGEGHGGGIAPGAILLLGSAISYGIYNVVQKPLLDARGAAWVVSWAIWIGTILLLPWAPSAWSAAARAPWQAWASVAYLGLLTTALGFMLWSWSLQRVHVSRLSPVLYLVPVISLVTAAIGIGERPTAVSLAGCVVVVGGVVLATRVLARGPVIIPPRAALGRDGA